MGLKPPNPEQLYEAALRHLERYAATEANMARVLGRRIDRWRQVAGEDDAEGAEIAARRAKTAIPQIIAKLTALGALNDAAFAVSRAKRLTREGKSRRAIMANLAAKGVATANSGALIGEDPARELAAACAYLRRRRAGPFGDVPEMKILAAMARNGFSQQTARHALRLDRDEAEGLIKSLQT